MEQNSFQFDDCPFFERLSWLTLPVWDHWWAVPREFSWKVTTKSVFFRKNHAYQFVLTWLALLDVAYLTWTIWLDLVCSSDVFTSSCAYIHMSRRIGEGKHHLERHHVGVIGTALHENRLVFVLFVWISWVVFNSTETSWPFHFMSCVTTTLFFSFRYPLGV